MFIGALKLLNKSNNGVIESKVAVSPGTAFVWRERHHYWVEYHYETRKAKPARKNVGQKKVNKFVIGLKVKGWKVFIKMPDKKGFSNV